MTTWMSSRGPIRVANMADSHLTNTIKFLQRRSFQERSNRIVRAAIMLSSELPDLMEMDVTSFAPDIYHTMVEEASSRGLPQEEGLQ